MSNTIIILILYCTSTTVLGANLKKVLCSYDDEQCLSESTKAIYPIIVAGRPGEVEASDPLYIEEIITEQPDFKFVLSMSKMSGLQNCTVKDVLVTAEKAFFNYYIWCPSLAVESNYETDGQIDGTPFKGKGTSKIVFSNYDIWLRGYYDKLIDKSGDLHTQITSFTIELRAGEVARVITGLSFGENESTGDVFEENLKRLEMRTREPIMYRFFKKYVKNLNSFLKIVPIKDIHYQLVED